MASGWVQIPNSTHPPPGACWQERDPSPLGPVCQCRPLVPPDAGLRWPFRAGRCHGSRVGQCHRLRTDHIHNDAVAALPSLVQPAHHLGRLRRRVVAAPDANFVSRHDSAVVHPVHRPGVFFLLDRFLDRRQRSFLLLAAACAALACLTRYIGVAVLASALLISMFRDKLGNIAAYSVISMAPIRLWMARNFLVANSVLGQPRPTDLTLLSSVDSATSELVRWFFRIGASIISGRCFPKCRVSPLLEI